MLRAEILYSKKKPHYFIKLQITIYLESKSNEFAYQKIQTDQNKFKQSHIKLHKT